MAPRTSIARGSTNGASHTDSPRGLRASQGPAALNASTSRKRPAVSTADGTPASSPRKKQATAARVQINPLPRADPLRTRIPEGKLLEIFCFGQNASGELGMDTPNTEVGVPKKHTWFSEETDDDNLGPHGVEDIVMGGMHALAMTSNPKVWSWGNNDESALGRITYNEDETMEPREVNISAGSRINQVAAGDSASAFVDAEGALYVCGVFRGPNGQMGLLFGGPKIQQTPIRVKALEGIPVSMVAAGTHHMVALTTEGHIYTWGEHNAGELGRHAADRRPETYLLPQRIRANYVRDIVAVWAGASHSFAVDKEGKLYGWGLNAVRQLGTVEEDGPEEVFVKEPRHLSFFDPQKLGSRVVQVAGGNHHSLFLLEDGRVYVAGRFASGQLGLGKDHPIIQAVAAEAATARHERESLATDLKAQYANRKGATAEMAIAKKVDQLKRSVLEAIDEPALLEVVSEPDVKIVHVAATQDRSMAVDSRGRVWAWGRNTAGLGLGSAVEEVDVPTEIAKFRTSGIIAVKAEVGGGASFVLGYRVPKPPTEDATATPNPPVPAMPNGTA